MYCQLLGNSAAGRRNSGRITHDETISTVSSSLNSSLVTTLIMWDISWNNNQIKQSLYTQHYNIVTINTMHCSTCTRTAHDVFVRTQKPLHLIYHSTVLPVHIGWFHMQVATYSHSVLRLFGTRWYLTQIFRGSSIGLLEEMLKMVV